MPVQPESARWEGTLDFRKLIDYWKQIEQGSPVSWHEQLLQGQDWLLGEAVSADEARRAPRVLSSLLMPIFPAAFQDEEIGLALVPGTLQVVYATSGAEAYLSTALELSEVISTEAVPALVASKEASTRAYVLRSLFGIEAGVEETPVLPVTDPATGLVRYVRFTFDYRFVDVHLEGDLEELRRSVIEEALKGQAASDLAGSVRLQGFEVLRGIDVTDQEAVSLLKGDLLEGERGISGSTLQLVEERVRVFLRKAQVNLGIAATDGEQLRLLRATTRRVGDPFAAGYLEPALLVDTPVGQAITERKPQSVPDLQVLAGSSENIDQLLSSGVRSLLVMPLFHRGTLTGLLYLWSPEAGLLTEADLDRIEQIVPYCSAAVNRSKEELNHRIQSVILGEYTAVHPSVEWRFRQAALNFIRKQDRGLRAEVEPIVFEDVYPLYAVTDIRASSMHRNEAVQFDLIDHLAALDDILRLARKQKPLPILDHLSMRSEAFRKSLESGLASDEEASIKDYIGRNVEPLLEHLSSFSPEVEKKVLEYQEALEPSGRLYSRCRDFDQSVEIVNHTISSYLDAEEKRAQAMFPHYFEKHQTDGVDFSIYVGASLLEDGTFNPLYVRNLRLWQLMVMCGIARRTMALMETLPMALETTQLILAHASPITIRFQLAESRFDVDGTYHIRYEIMKRRIDKAHLKGNEERLTQPGKIAIVYSQQREAWEYEEYIRFLQGSGYLGEEVEDVEISDLQGVKGLKAIRVSVLPGDVSSGDGIGADIIERAIQAMPKERN